MSREPAAAHDARTGARDAVDLPPGFEFFALPPAEAIRYFQALGIEPTWDYREMWTAEQRRAFTVAKLTQLDLLEFAYREVDRGIAEGMSLSEFQQRMTERLDEAGWGGVLGSSRLENIYRTNLASAYSAGEWERIEASAAERAANGEVTYLEFNAVGDSRTREDHEARSGTVLPVTDPWFLENTPPLDFNCRCWLTEHTESTLARYGLKPTERPDTPPVEVENPHTGERFTVPQGVAPGFGRHNWDTAVREIYDQRMAAALPAVRRAVGWGVTEVQLQPRPLARLAERLQSGSVEDLRAENLHPEKIGASEQPDAKFYADIPEGAARALAREARLLGVREYEHVTGFDRWGITVLPRTTSDERDGVTLPKVEWIRAQDGYVIHTHPVGLPFSRRDLEQAIRRNFAGIAVVGPASDGSIIEFLVLRPKHGWGSIARLKSLYAEEQAHVAAFLPEIETLTREEIRWLVRDGVWSALDRRGIVRYRRRRK